MVKFLKDMIGFLLEQILSTILAGLYKVQGALYVTDVGLPLPWTWAWISHCQVLLKSFL